MKLIKKVALLIFVGLLLFIGHIFITTGFFRTIENHFDGTILKKINLPGAEDITVSHSDKFAIISSTNRQKFPPIEEELGGLYYLDLKDKNSEPILLSGNFQKPFAPHGISMIKTDSTYKIMAINHTTKGHSIEVFLLDGQRLTHTKTLTHTAMVSPNDIVMIDRKRFYFTNDHNYVKGLGRFLEDYVGMALANVIYCDGENYQIAADAIAYANGINLDTSRNLLFVASPRKFLVKVYQMGEDGSLRFIENIDCGTGVDNIEFDSRGNLWIGAHPNLLRFASYAKGNKKTAPSEIIKISYRAKADYTVESVYLEDGREMSAASVAVPFDDLILTGNVMDSKFLILKRNQ